MTTRRRNTRQDRQFLVANGSEPSSARALDQRGHGDSDPAEVYDPIAAFGDVSGVVDQLGLALLVPIGPSMGGRDGMHFAAKRPRPPR